MVNFFDTPLPLESAPDYSRQTIDKIRAVRQLIDASARPVRLEVDGGVKADNIARIASAGADTFVSGSAIFGADSYAEVIAEMRRELDTVRSI